MDATRIIITGPTSGIGKEIAIQLGSRGAQVILACRDVKRGEEVAEQIRQCAAAAEPAVIAVDTSSQASIRAFAREFKRRYDRLDVLVNNAGTLRQRRQSSVDGIELTFATNVIGYYLMTSELLDMLQARSPSRVVNVASTFASDLELDDLQFERRPYDGMKAYAQSKACDRMLTWALARRLAGTGVSVNAVAPGLVTETHLYRDLPADIRRQLQQQPSRTIADGADTAIWLAGRSDVDGASGSFYELRTEQPCQFRDSGAEDRLLKICEAMVSMTHQVLSTP
jgi:NAD(P)-dependent dehydrogenase (short-subunit alcohol dehydrogenase family)